MLNIFSFEPNRRIDGHKHQVNNPRHNWNVDEWSKQTTKQWSRSHWGSGSQHILGKWTLKKLVEISMQVFTKKNHMRFQWISILGGQPIKRLKSVIEPSLTKYFCLGFALNGLPLHHSNANNRDFMYSKGVVYQLHKGEMLFRPELGQKSNKFQVFVSLKTCRIEHSRSGMVNNKKQSVISLFWKLQFSPEKTPVFFY